MISISPKLSLVASAQTVGDYKCQAIVEGFPPVVSKLAKMSIVTKPTIVSDKVECDFITSSYSKSLFRISLVSLERG